MHRPDTFSYDFFAFSPKDGRIVLQYSLGDDAFHEELTLPMEGVDTTTVDWEAFDRALFALHLIGGVSYWKAHCPRTLIVKTGTLTPEQAAFFNAVYTEGMGEFYFVNKIDFRDLVHFPVTPSAVAPELHGPSTTRRAALVPVGGGKDSIVTTELLKAASVPFTTLTIGGGAPLRACASAIGAPTLAVDRRLDPRLFALNTQPGVYNGHIPITAYNSIVALLIAILHEHSDVVWSLEHSASEGNVEYLGMSVNHQYSKSLDFERRLQSYLAAFVTRRVRSFSLLRPWSELCIVEEFVRHPKYFPLFSSCNRNFTQASAPPATRWCGECPKCAFVFTMLGAFLPHGDVVQIFGADLYESDALIPTLRQLLGRESHKPFECVGTAEETAAALELAYRRDESRQTPWMQYYAGEVRDSFGDLDALIHRTLAPARDHAIPHDYAGIVTK